MTAVTLCCFIIFTQANSWCNDGISLLANQQLDKFDTSSGARLALSDVDSFLSTSGEFELGDFDDLQNKYEPVLSPVHKVRIQYFGLLTINTCSHQNIK